jgi:RNA-binding protein YlmH
MTSAAYRVARIQQTLNRFENDLPLLNLRVKELSAEGQKSARQFAAALIEQTRAELQRALAEQPEIATDAGDMPCEPAD